MFERIAIMGAGALGTILGAYIAKTRQVDLINRNKAHVEALNKHGARLRVFENATIPVTAYTLDEMEGTYDLFLYFAKQTANSVALPIMKKHSHEGTFVCTGQNGLPEDAIIKFFEPDKVFGAPAGWGGVMAEPGVIDVLNPPEKRKFVLGSVNGNITAELLEVKKILELLCPVDLTENLVGYRWAKLTANATFSGMSAVMCKNFGEVAADPRGIRCVARIGRECIKAAGAEGVKMEAFGPLDSADMYSYATAEEEDRLVSKIQEDRKGSKAQASMLNDLRRGYTNVEIDDINGVICKAGKKHGIPTPYNDMVVKIVKGICDGSIPLSESNIDYFDALLNAEI